MSLNTSVVGNLQSSSLATPPWCPHFPYIQSESILNPNLNIFKLKSVQFKIVEPSPVTRGIGKVCLSYRCPSGIERLQSGPLYAFSRQHKLNSFILFAQEACSMPLISFVALLWTCAEVAMSFEYWSPQSCAQHSRSGLTTADERGRIVSCDLVGPGYSWLSGMPCWHMFSILSSSSCKSFSTVSLLVNSSHSLC